MEQTLPLRQASIIDVRDWNLDAEFAVFPQGARAKEAVFCPDAPSDPCLVPTKRYLFKRSKRSYPDQFWGEIVAYRVGCAMGLQVPPAFAAYNSETGHSAALIEWFYRDEAERFIFAGDFLQSFIPDFDRERGSQHNLADAALLLRIFATRQRVSHDWRQWLSDMLAFDAVIGNTDRHQDNWGFILWDERDGVPRGGRMAPLFDNGTSLGHERFTDRVAHWKPNDLDRYVGKGCHHMGESREAGAFSAKHVALLLTAIEHWPESAANVRQRLEWLDGSLPNLIDDLHALGGPVPLSADRAKFMMDLLTCRLAKLQAALR